MIAMPVALIACSVKEDRSVCPCELTVRSAEKLSSDGRVLVSVIQDGAVVKQGMMSRREFEEGACVLTVPRKPSTVTVFTGITDMDMVSGRTLDIREENECDKVFSSIGSVLPVADTCSCTVIPRKNYANLFLEVVGMPQDGSVRILGKVHGYDVVSLSPREGPFAFVPEGSLDGTYKCVIRLPRQTDDSLTLEVLSGDSLLETVPAGRLIKSSGYDFDEESLPDITLTVDLTRSSAAVRIADWDFEGSTILNF